jgi:L-amino acid N-acyltransferase YncA
MKVRHADSARDAADCAAIYAPFVEATAISLEERVPTAADFAARISRIEGTHPWLVAEHPDRLAGFAYGCPHRERAGYRFTAEVTVYVDPAFQRQGVGRGPLQQPARSASQAGAVGRVRGDRVAQRCKCPSPRIARVSPRRRLQEHRIQAWKVVGRWLVAAFTESTRRRGPRRTGSARTAGPRADAAPRLALLLSDPWRQLGLT